MKRIVIVGGGFAGSIVAKALQDAYDVTLVDTKPYFEFTPGILRTIVEPEHVRSVQRLHTHYLNKATVIQGDALEIKGKMIKVGKQYLPFEYLVLAMGSRYAQPIKEENVISAERAHHLRDSYQHVEKAKTVALVGGGITGVELAAEIATHYPGKTIYLIHGKKKLCEHQPEKVGAYARAFLEAKGVQIVYDRVQRMVRKTLLLASGEKLHADIVFLCTGITPHTELARSSKLSVDERGFIKVNEQLQVTGHPSIFAAGDATNADILKTAQHAGRQARLVVENIRALDEGKTLETYRSRVSPLVISLGKYDGIFAYKSFMLTGFLPAFLKWFVEKKEMWKYR